MPLIVPLFMFGCSIVLIPLGVWFILDGDTHLHGGTNWLGFSIAPSRKEAYQRFAVGLICWAIAIGMWFIPMPEPGVIYSNGFIGGGPW